MQINGKRRQVISASTLCGFRVRSKEGEDLGIIEELMLDAGSGSIAYAVISFGASTGLGDRLFAIPWSMLALSREDRALTLHVDRDVLGGAPGFDQDAWPDLGDESWHSRIQNHYGLMEPAYT